MERMGGYRRRARNSVGMSIAQLVTFRRLLADRRGEPIRRQDPDARGILIVNVTSTLLRVHTLTSYFYSPRLDGLIVNGICCTCGANALVHASCILVILLLAILGFFV